MKGFKNPSYKNKHRKHYSEKKLPKKGNWQKQICETRKQRSEKTQKTPKKEKTKKEKSI